MMNPTITGLHGQPEQMFVCMMHTERIDPMSELQPLVSVSLSPMQALRECIERETPALHVMAVYEAAPRPYLLVKDNASGIIITFSSKEEYLLYCQVVLRQRDRKEAAR